MKALKWPKSTEGLFSILMAFLKIFLSILIFLHIFCSLPQKSKIADEQNGSKRNSITQCPILMKFDTNVKNDIVYKTMKILFNVSFLNHVAKYHNWLRPGYHGNQFENPALLFCVCCSHVSTQSMVSIGCLIFELHLLPCLGNQRPCLVTMATEAKQPLFFTTRHHGLQ